MVSSNESADRERAVREALRLQARACGRLGSPFMARLMTLLAERLSAGDGAVAARVLGWPGDPAIGADNPALRLAGALHGLVIDGADAGLTAAYPPKEVPDVALWRAVSDALERHEARILDWLDRAPQTNEVRRAAALIPAFAMVARATRLPLALWELGCASGLNLRADRFSLRAGETRFGPDGAAPVLVPDWDGPAPKSVPLEVVERVGVDLAPIDPLTDRTRLLAYLWPDQPERRALTEAAIAVAAAFRAEIVAEDAVTFLYRRLPHRRKGAVTVLYHTVAWQYLPPKAQAEGDALITAAGAAATPAAPLARVSLENDGQRQAALTLTLWPGGETYALARVDFHGRALRWEGPVAL